MHICCLSCVVVFNPAELPEDLEPVLPGPVPARHGPAQPAPPPPLPATEPAPPAPALPAPGPALPPHASLLRVLTVAVDTPPQHGDVHAIGSPASCGNGSPASCGNGSPSIYMATPPTGQAAHHFHRGAAADAATDDHDATAVAAVSDACPFDGSFPIPPAPQECGFQKHIFHTVPVGQSSFNNIHFGCPSVIGQ